MPKLPRPGNLLPLMSVLAALAGPIRAQDAADTRLLGQPDIGAGQVVFVHAEDLWLCSAEGAVARRLTTHPGVETRPRISPDGQWVAFSGQYDGNTDVYLVPAAGGEPRRLTWHPGEDLVQDFSPDGTRVLFTSGRYSYTRRHTQLFEVPVAGGFPEPLPIPHAAKACYSPDGSHIAYQPLGDAFRQWKHYRGGRTARIWLYDRASHAVEQIPQPEGRCNDTDPMWIGERVYFRSDREGEFNLYVYEPANGDVRRLTAHTDFPVVEASAGDSQVVYEQAGWIHVYDIDAGDSRRLRITAPAEQVEARPRWVSGERWIRSADLSPSGARAVVEYRGEVFTVPAKKGDPRNLTRTAGAHERSPAWSPDGERIAYFSDRSGEYRLYIAGQRHGEIAQSFDLPGAGFYSALQWSPDGKKLSFRDNALTLRWLDLDSGAITEVDRDPIYGPASDPAHSWSPDSRWIAYTRVTRTNFRQVFLHSLEQGRSFAVTDGMSDVGSPVFDRNGKYLYMAGSTDAGPVRQWFAMSNADMEMHDALYVAVLAGDQPSPLRPESDEEKAGDEPAVAEAAAKSAGDVPVPIDLDGLGQRIVALPVEQGLVTGMAAGKGELFYSRRPAGSGDATLYRWSMTDRKEEVVATGVRDFRLSAQGDKLLVQSGSELAIVAARPKADLQKGKLATDRIRVRIDPRAEWRQIFDEAWRINRDWFYDPGMHGCDWPEMRAKYSVFLPHLTTRSDLNRVIRWMCSELAVGHHRVGGGDRLYDPEPVPVGLLGADWTVADGRYRLRKIYGGLNWNPGLRAPLTEPGVDVREGDYLLAVHGIDLRPPENLYSRFEQQVGRIVELTVATSPDGAGARTVEVVPIASEAALRNRAWVEGNLARVHEATGGRVAYVYVPNTAGTGHRYFKRYFFPQADKEAIIVDERHNGGGQIADYYIDLLSRRPLSWWTTRYGADFPGPLSAIAGPKVLLIDETAGSGGDLFPYMFRRAGLGPLIGKTTWGGLVGILGFPPLIDGGRITAPNLAFWNEQGFRIENEGVAPDIEVEQWPAEVIAGMDPQLEKAIEVVLQRLEANPPKRPERPPFPVRAKGR